MQHIRPKHIKPNPDQVESNRIELRQTKGCLPDKVLDRAVKLVAENTLVLNRGGRYVQVVSYVYI